MNARVPTPVLMPAPDEFEFDFDGTRVRGRLLDGGDPWLVGGEVATALGHRDAHDLARTLDEDEKGTHTVRTPGGPQQVLFISEAGLYRAILQRRGIAKLPATTKDRIYRFQRMVFHDVLPQIRRTGSYAVAPQPVPAPAAIDVRDPGQLAVITAQLIAVLDEERQAHALTHAHLEDTSRLLASETRARQVTTAALSEAHGKLDAQRPAVLAQERMAASEGCLTASEVAVTLRVERTAVIEHLVAIGYLTRAGSRDRLRCTREGVRAGWVLQGPDRGAELRSFTKWHPVITGLGLAGLSEHFCRGAEAAGQPALPGL